jgi:hypothetical protein
LFSRYYDDTAPLLFSRGCFCYIGIVNHLWSPKMSMMPTQLSRPQAGVPLSVAAFRSWLARARPGEPLEYYRGHLGMDRVKGTSSLSDPERRNLNAVADHTLALSNDGRLHLLQERHGDNDYSYWAVTRAPARPVSHFSSDHRSRGPRL